MHSANKTPSSFDYLVETLKSCAKRRTQRKTYQEKGHPDIFRCASITDSQVEYGYLYYQNDSRTGATLKETIVFNSLENFTLLKEEGSVNTQIERRDGSGEYVVNVRVPPGSSLIVIMRRTERAASYQVTYFSALVFPEESYLSAIQALTRGRPEKEVKRAKEQLGIIPSQHMKMLQVEYQGQPTEIHFTSMVVGDGYLWLLENLTANQKFEAIFNFQLTNL
jgi:hypothetical protein